MAARAQVPAGARPAGYRAIACEQRNTTNSDGQRETIMSSTLINLIIQLIAGAIGGNATGATMKNLDLGTLGNTIAGALGGAGGGTLLTALLPMLQGAAGGNVDIAALAGQAVGGGVAGAIVTAIVGMIKNSAAGGAR
jgi:hypothetical protein